jgi:hypothetical protein
MKKLFMIVKKRERVPLKFSQLPLLKELIRSIE